MKIVLLLPVVLMLSGCCSRLPALVRELAKDPATVDVEVYTPYGKLIYHRDNHGATNLPAARKVSP